MILTFADFINESRANKSRVQRIAKKVIVFKLGNFNIDDKMLDVIDDADESYMEASKFYLYFLDEDDANKTFRKLAKLWGATIKNKGAMKQFTGDAGFSGEMMSPDQLKESVSIDESFFSRTSPYDLIRKGFVKITSKEAKDLMNDPLQREVFDLKQVRDHNGTPYWYKGPSKCTKVFKSKEEAELAYNSAHNMYLDTPSAYIPEEDIKAIKKENGFVLIQNGRDHTKWQLFIARKIDD